MEQDYKPVYEEVNPENLIGVEIEKGSLEDVKDVFDYDKDSVTIQKEIEHFEKEGATVEQEESFGFDDFSEGGEFEESQPLGITNEEEEEEEDKGEIEDYYDSAEFVIFVTEIILVFATNFYLKYNKLEKITIDAFNKTKSQHKLLVRSWAKVLQKHNAKVSAEMELLFALGSAYGMKMSSIVQQQKALAYDKLMSKSNVKVITDEKDLKIVKKEDKKNSGVAFDVDFENVEENNIDEHKEFRDNMFNEEKQKDKPKTKNKQTKGKTALVDLI